MNHIKINKYTVSGRDRYQAEVVFNNRVLKSSVLHTINECIDNINFLIKLKTNNEKPKH